MKQDLEKFFSSFRQYRVYDSKLTISKIWNRGNGLLELFRFYPDKKVILINSSLFNYADKKHLNEFINQHGMNEWKQVEKSYSYPEYYRHSFAL